MQPLFVNLEPYKETVSSVLSSYSFTVAGFLATIATFIYAFNGKPFFELYRRRGSFNDLVFFHVLLLINLICIFVFSLVLLAYPSLIRITLILTILSLGMLLFLTIIYYNLSTRSNP